MSKKKKINPRRIPVSRADIETTKDKSIHLCMAIFLTVLKDDFAFTQDQVVHAWNRIDKLSKEVAEGRLNIKDLIDVLNEEYDIELR